MSNDDDLGAFEHLAKGRHELAFCRAIQNLSPLGGPLCGPPARCQPSRRSLLTEGRPGRTISTLPPGTLSAHRAIEVRTEGQIGLSKGLPSSFTRLCRLYGLSRCRRPQSWTGTLPGKPTKSFSFLDNPNRKTKKRSHLDGHRKARKGAPTDWAGTPMHLI
jgi:hypothetical protein